MSLSAQLKELGQLARNVSDAAATGQVDLFMAEHAEWAIAVTRLVSETAIELHHPDRTRTAPEGVPVLEELAEEICTFEDADCNRCVLGAEHVGDCQFPAKAVRR